MTITIAYLVVLVVYICIMNNETVSITIDFVHLHVPHVPWLKRRKARGAEKPHPW